jgi:hypothetical protein
MSEIVIKNKDKWKSELELKTLCSARIDQLSVSGAPIDISSGALESVLRAAMDILIGRGLLQEKDNLFRMDETEINIVSYYANSIAHWK